MHIYIICSITKKGASIIELLSVAATAVVTPYKFMFLTSFFLFSPEQTLPIPDERGAALAGWV